MRPIEINGKTLILFESNAYTRSCISRDSISVTGWQDLLFLYIFSKFSSGLFYFPHDHIIHLFPSTSLRAYLIFPTIHQLNSLLRCELCVIPQTHQFGF